MDNSHFSVLKLKIYLSGEVTGEIKCNNNQSYTMVCTENGEWNYSSVTNVCHSISQNNSGKFKLWILSTYNYLCNSQKVILLQCLTWK